MESRQGGAPLVAFTMDHVLGTMGTIILMSSPLEGLMSWRTVFYYKFGSCSLGFLVAGNLINRLSSSPNSGLSLIDAKRRLCHSLLNSTGVIRHYQLRGTSLLPHATATLWASLPLDNGIQKTEHVFHRQCRELPADQLSQRAFNRFVKPNNLTHFSSGERV